MQPVTLQSELWERPAPPIHPAVPVHPCGHVPQLDVFVPGACSKQVLIIAETAAWHYIDVASVYGGKCATMSPDHVLLAILEFQKVNQT